MWNQQLSHKQRLFAEHYQHSHWQLSHRVVHGPIYVKKTSFFVPNTRCHSSSYHSFLFLLPVCFFLSSWMAGRTRVWNKKWWPNSLHLHIAWRMREYLSGWQGETKTLQPAIVCSPLWKMDDVWKENDLLEFSGAKEHLWLFPRYCPGCQPPDSCCIMLRNFSMWWEKKQTGICRPCMQSMEHQRVLFWECSNYQ